MRAADAVELLDQLDELLVTERRRRGIDRESAARQMGLSDETLRLVERPDARGKRGPTLYVVRAVLAWIADETLSPTPPAPPMDRCPHCGELILHRNMPGEPDWPWCPACGSLDDVDLGRIALPDPTPTDHKEPF